MKTNMYARKKWFLVLGIVAIAIGFIILIFDAGKAESNIRYGGDAYTGIQNASAQVANNLVALSWIVKLCFSSTFIITGLILIAISSTIVVETNQTVSQPITATQTIASDYSVSSEQQATSFSKEGEIEKYKELLSNEAITQEEYDKAVENL